MGSDLGDGKSLLGSPKSGEDGLGSNIGQMDFERLEMRLGGASSSFVSCCVAVCVEAG